MLAASEDLAWALRGADSAQAPSAVLASNENHRMLPASRDCLPIRLSALANFVSPCAGAMGTISSRNFSRKRLAPPALAPQVVLRIII